MGVSSGGGAGQGSKQIINGQPYTIYSPEWYSAMRANEIQKGTTAGQVAGATETGFLGSIPASISGLMTGGASAGALGTGTGTTGTAGVSPSGPVGSGSGSSGAGISPPQLPDPTIANAQTFARAKDTVGATGRASIDALTGELGASGMMGGGAQVQGTRDVVNQAQEELGKVATGQAETTAQQQADFAKTGYEGEITQRGQNIQAQEAAANLELAKNNAAFQQSYLKQQQLQNMLQMALSGLGSGTSVATNPSLY